VRIALATVGTTGDVAPFVALAEALVGGGHSVTALSWELNRATFDPTGATFRAAGPPTSSADIATTAARAAAAGSPLAQVAVLRDFHLRDAEDHYRTLRDALPGHDLVVLHGIHTLAEAASRDAGLRYATAVFDPVLLPTATAAPAGMPQLGPLNRLAWGMLDRMLRRLDGPLMAALTDAGSASAGAVTMFRARSPRLHLVAVSPSIAPPPRDVEPSTHFTGAWFHRGSPEPLPTAVAEFLESGDPPVAVTFGSMAAPDRAALIGAVVAGARAAGLRVIAQHSGPVDQDASNDVLQAGAMDHHALFPRVHAVVHHGGAGTSHAVARAGVPSLVVPHVGDQPFWAARLHALGAASRPLRLRDVRPEIVAARLRTLADPGLRSRAVQLGERVRGEDGIGAAVKLLEAEAAE